jgi:hypothetical protein
VVTRAGLSGTIIGIIGRRVTNSRGSLREALPQNKKKKGLEV